MTRIGAFLGSTRMIVALVSIGAAVWMPAAAWSATTACLGPPPGASPDILVANADGIGGTGVSGDDDGIGGTGFSNGSDGIGGTGHDEGPDGIGGTGFDGELALSGRGVEGLSNASLDRIRASGSGDGADVDSEGGWLALVTGLDANCPDGETLEIGDDTLVEENGAHIHPSLLRIGHVIWVDSADSDPEDRTLDISLRPMIEGPVTGLDASMGRLEVMGEAIEIGESVTIEDETTGASLTLADIGVGDSVVVHGGRAHDGHVIASYVGRRLRSDLARVRGIAVPLEDRNAVEGIRVGQVRVEAIARPQITSGHWVEATGRWDATTATLTQARIVDAEASMQSGLAENRNGETRGVRTQLGSWAPTSTR